jgi:hypothetical protein
MAKMKIYIFDDVCFVNVLRGLYMKTHVCVALVACPSCKAKKGSPCTGRTRLPTAATHLGRREDAERALKKKRARRYDVHIRGAY